MDRIGRRRTVGGMYLGIVAALAALVSASGGASMAWGGLLAGLFLVGGQSVLYALASSLYPTEVRGTGVGAAVAVGRMGSILGPLIAGQLLAIGQGASVLLSASIPLIAIAAIAAWLVVSKPVSARAYSGGRAIGPRLPTNHAGSPSTCGPRSLNT